jgi:transposase
MSSPGKKGRRYGSILVDLEAHRVLALLPDRDVETGAAWFRAHPSVLMVTRDRSGAFAEAIRTGAPQATQIADRFHLAMNAATCLASMVTRDQAQVRRGIQDLREQQQASLPPPSPTVYSHQRESHQRRTRRQDRYQQSITLHQQGWSKSAIAREVGIHRDTIARYLQAEGFPERRNRPARPKTVNQYLAYVQQRWAEGEHNGQRFYQDLRALGYHGGTPMVYGVIRPWHNFFPLSPSGECCSDLSFLFTPTNDLAAIEIRRTADTG